MVSACTGATSTAPTTTPLLPTSLVVTVPADTQALTKSTSTRIVNPNQNLTAIADALYCNSEAQAGRNIYCQACHASPHAIYPAITTRDNEQSIRLQGHSRPIVECVVCHMENPDEAFWHFGGDN